ncbi:MAG: 50S ribosomal protein L9 [bacterium]
MEIILKQNVEKLGKQGSKVKVKNGYAKNYLIPKNFAIKANLENIKIYEHEKKMHLLQITKCEKEAKIMAEKLNKISLTISKQSGENDKLFGSVTTQDIVEALKKEHYVIDKKQIMLEEPIKQLGVYTISVKLYQNITTQIKVWVTKE